MAVLPAGGVQVVGGPLLGAGHVQPPIRLALMLIEVSSTCTTSVSTIND